MKRQLTALGSQLTTRVNRDPFTLPTSEIPYISTCSEPTIKGHGSRRRRSESCLESAGSEPTNASSAKRDSARHLGAAAQGNTEPLSRRRAALRHSWLNSTTILPRCLAIGYPHAHILASFRSHCRGQGPSCWVRIDSVIGGIVSDTPCR